MTINDKHISAMRGNTARSCTTYGIGGPGPCAIHCISPHYKQIMAMLVITIAMATGFLPHQGEVTPVFRILSQRQQSKA